MGTQVLSKEIRNRQNADDHKQISLTNQPAGDPACIIYCNHPLAFQLIKNALASDPEFSGRVQRYGGSKIGSDRGDGILILDTCSVERWQKVLEEWHAQNGRSIALISSDVQNTAEELQMLYMGVNGIIVLTDALTSELVRAVRVIWQGGFWVKRVVLTEYVKRTNLFLRNLSSPDLFFTTREQEILAFLRQGFSNKQIANALGISERTAKFHVSNILRKCRIETRHELPEVRPRTHSFKSHQPS
jgi:DNA-binding NarL/FixJ family response regulator